MFRRGSAGARGETAQDEGAEDAGAPQTKTADRVRPVAEQAKGRPTPKRSEAQRGLKQGVTGARSGAGGKGATRTKQSSADARADRARRAQAMRRGEDWALLPRDRGPVKALARDYVDSRRRVSEYLFYVLLAVIIVSFAVRVAVVQTYIDLAAIILLVIAVGDARLQASAVRRLADQRFPGESTRGLALYVAMRTINPRRLRSPSPRVQRGDEV